MFFAKKKTIVFSAFVMALTLIVSGYFILGNISSKTAMVRTIELQKSVISNQAIFDEFEDADLTVTDKLATFVGYKNLDASVFSMLDNLSVDEKEELAENCKVRYYFTYDKESNIVTISAEMSNEFGEIEMDTISGVGFINDKNEIDAVMNVEGEGILLSEMSDAGLIQNAGWFSKLVKAVAVTVAVVAVVVVVAAAVVVTAGTAAPALVAAGVGVSTTVVAGSVATAAAIGTYAALTAAIAAGVALTADLVDKYYPGIQATTTTTTAGTTVVTAQWSKDKTKEAIKDIAISQTKTNPNNPAIYFHVTQYSNSVGPVTVSLEPYTKEIMSLNMKQYSWSSITGYSHNAQSVIFTAFAPLPIIEETHGMPHFHAVLPDKSHAKGLNGLYVVHSFYSGLIAA
ncbi:MAG TPA: hypothetical protein VIL26_04120 [Clostridia bacterium]